jgi:hypothetical protein
MPRESRSIRLDTRVWAVIDFLAAKSGIPFQRWLERYFFDRGKAEGLIDPNENPPPDGRGGKRSGAGRKRG